MNDKGGRLVVLLIVVGVLNFVYRHPWLAIKTIMFIVLNGREAFAKKLHDDLMKPFNPPLVIYDE